MGPENKAKGEKFMDDIDKTPGVTKLASGLVYKVIKEGEGVKPAATDMATVSFHATLVDGTEVWKMEHASIPVTHQLIPPGVTEALTLMKAGSHWTVYLPYPPAYGEKPGISDPRHGYKVGPFSALNFDLELESVQPRPAPPAGPPPGMRSGGPITMPPGTAVTPPSRRRFDAGDQFFDSARALRRRDAEGQEPAGHDGRGDRGGEEGGADQRDSDQRSRPK